MSFEVIILGGSPKYILLRQVLTRFIAVIFEYCGTNRAIANIPLQLQKRNVL
jgi:hypothetical protein